MTVAEERLSRSTGKRSKREIALSLLLAGQFLAIGGLLQYYAWVKEDSWQLRFYAVSLLVIAVTTMYAVWTQKAWAPWFVLVTVSLKIVVDALNWAEGLDRLFIPLSEVINGSIIVLVFVTYAYPSSDRVTRGMKVFFGFVLLLAAVVGYWGYLVPGKVEATLPFAVPELHARFLGAMYLSGATFMILGIRARWWSEVRVMVPMIAIWTGMLGVVSLLNLEAFDWSIKQTWIWWVAYVAYPLIAAWITYVQRKRKELAQGPLMSTALRMYLYVQGAIVTVLAVALFIVPDAMAARWPWAIPPVLAHIYCAPFFSYGLGSLYAATRRKWNEVRIPVYSTLVFTLGVLTASVIHRELFDLSSVVGIAWFTSFAIASIALAAFGVVPRLRTGSHPPVAN